MTQVANQTQAPVLIVEDHADTAEMLRRLLTRNGFIAEVAHNAKAALDLLSDHKPACLILDENMPGMTGLDLLRYLHSEPHYRDIPVLFYSAAYDPQMQAEAHALGAKAWFIKGVSRLPDLINHLKAQGAA